MKLVGASALIAVGYLLFVKALTIGAVGTVVPLSSIYPMLTLGLSIVFLHQVYRHLQIAAMVLIVFGAVLLAYEKNRHKEQAFELYKASIFTLAAVLMWGVGFFIINPLIPKVQWQVISGLLYLVCLSIAALLMLFVYKGSVWPAVIRTVTNRTMMLTSLLMAAGTIILYIGAGRVGNIIIPVVLSSLSPLLAAALGAVVDNEKLGFLKRAGAILAVGGIVLLNVH